VFKLSHDSSLLQKPNLVVIIRRIEHFYSYCDVITGALGHKIHQRQKSSRKSIPTNFPRCFSNCAKLAVK
jgi:hypothetical protein